jgi:hypothetical protein
MAEYARRSLPDAELYLITDQVEYWKVFPGKVVEYSRNNRTTNFKKYVSMHPEQEFIAKGYWLFTLERLFAFTTLVGLIPETQPILHFESDVYSLVTVEILEAMNRRLSKTAIPRLSEQTGIASILFSPSLKQLMSDMESLLDELILDGQISNDMRLLGRGLDSGILEELPTTFLDAWTLESQDEANGTPKQNILFDGAAIGQYLLGVDPIHTLGWRISGYQNPNYKTDLSKVSYSITELGELHIASENYEYRVCNLHIHSKVHADPISNSSEFWKRTIDEANQISPRVLGPYILDEIHGGGIAFRQRVRIVKTKGVFFVMRNKIKRLANGPRK